VVLYKVLEKEANMSVKLSVIYSRGKNVFACDGVSFDCGITASLLEGQETDIEISRAGVMVGTGHFGPRVPGGSADFSGFSQSDFFRIPYFRTISAEDFQIGDELVFPTVSRDDFLKTLCEFFIKSNFDWRQKLSQEFPYPLNWQDHIAEFSTIYDRRYEKTWLAIQSGELSDLVFPFGRFGHERGSKKFSIRVSKHGNKKWFEFKGVLFDRLPLLGCSLGLPETASTKVNIWRERKLQCRLTVATVGTVCEMCGYFSMDAESSPFLDGSSIAEYLLAINFQVGDRVVLSSPIGIDLIYELLHENPSIDDFLPPPVVQAYSTVLSSIFDKGSKLPFEVVTDALAQFGDERNRAIARLAKTKAINPIVFRS
jgi:hypothetical protein